MVRHMQEAGRENTVLWNKRQEENSVLRGTAEPPRPISTPPATPVRVEPSPRVEAPTARAAANAAVIGASMKIKGEIFTREDLVVDGEVEGVLVAQSSLTVGPNGNVRANIKAREVVIAGSVKGNVEVTEKIAIRDKGSLIGDIRTAGISIDDGAYFKGSIDIVRPEPVRQTKPTVSDPEVAEAQAAR